MLVKRLLTPDLTKRYGNLKNGVADIKEHKWFRGFDWNGLLKKQLEPPYKPTVKVSVAYRECASNKIDAVAEDCSFVNTVIQGIDDTSNFEAYPESTDQPAPVVGSLDPFNSW